MIAESPSPLVEARVCCQPGVMPGLQGASRRGIPQTEIDDTAWHQATGHVSRNGVIAP
jgi:hypothetical protein